MSITDLLVPVKHDAMDLFVLERLPLAGGAVLEQTARYRDDKWDLTPAIHQVHEHKYGIDFTTVPAAFRPQAKELMFLLLRGQVTRGGKQPALRSVYSVFCYMRRFLTWLDARGATTLAEVTADDIGEYKAHLVARGDSANVQSVSLGAVEFCYLAGETHPGDWLKTDPMVEASGLNIRRRRGENATDRIPEQVLSPLVVWAMRWVDDFSGDVLRAFEEWRRLFTAKGDSRRVPAAVERPERQHGESWVTESLTGFLERQKAAGRPLPAGRVPGRANLNYIARQIGTHHTVILNDPDRIAMIAETVAAVGLTDGIHLDVGDLALLDGQPWLDKITYAGAEELCRLLQTACYIVIIFLSGMREAEVKHLKHGCLRLWTDDRGQVARRIVKSRSFKGEKDAAGVDARWIVGAPVERAIRVLEKLMPEGSASLFGIPPSSKHYNTPSRYNSMERAKTTISTNRDLNYFAAWVSDYARRHGRDDGIPQVNGRDWHLMTRQFRRTLAWFVARRPGGIIAGAISYRHHSIQMFEGYAGTSDAGFRAEVEAEAALVRGEGFAAMAIHGEHHRLTGPAAAEAEARLTSFGTAEFTGKIMNDPKRLTKYLQRHDPRIYPGTFVTCVDNPDRRLCAAKVGDDSPDAGDCKPFRCRNAAFSPDNVLALSARVAEQTRMLGAGTLPPFVAARLAARRDEAAGFLDGLGAGIPENVSS